MSLKEFLKDSFLSGLLLLTPLIVTAAIISFALGFTSGLTGLFIDYFDLTSLTFRKKILAQVLVLTLLAILVLLVGTFSRSSYGRKTLGGFGRLVNIIPLYRSLYHSIKHLANSLAENRSSYRKAVLAEYPSEDIYRIGFVTSESSEKIEEAAGEQLLNVYIPNSPNPSAGTTAMMPREKIHDLDMTVKQAFKHVVTTGVSNEKIEEIIPE